MSTTQRMTAKNQAAKVARHRPTVLELAQQLGSVAEACRRSGMDRTSLSEWKRRLSEIKAEDVRKL